MKTQKPQKPQQTEYKEATWTKEQIKNYYKSNIFFFAEAVAYGLNPEKFITEAENTPSSIKPK